MCSTGVAGWLNVRGLSVELFPPDELYAGVPTAIRVRITSRKRWLPSFLLTVPMLQHSCSFFFLPPGAHAEQSLMVTLPSRGRHHLAPPWVASRFPASFFIRSWPAGDASEIIVLPAPLAGLLSATTGQTTGSDVPLQIKGWDGDLRAIAPYTGQEPAKLIHWQLSARHDMLLVRELQGQEGEPVIIDLDCLSPANRERDLARAVALINRCWQQQRPVGLIANGNRLEARHSLFHRRTLLREVALYGL